MEKKLFSNDYGSRTDIRNKQIIDYKIDNMIESYLDGWDPYDYGR